MRDLSPTDLQRLFQAGIELVVAASLGSARAIGVMLVLPVFTRPQIGGLIRGGLAIALALPLLPHIGDELMALEGGARFVKVVLLSLKEVFVGLLLGALISIPLWSIQAVGDIIDTQRGISGEVAPIDPATRSQDSATGLFLGITAITIFIVAGGLQITISGLYGSYRIWPALDFMPNLTGQSALELLGLVDHIMRVMLLVSGPVLVFLLLTDISVMLLGRFAPQFKPNDLAPTIKNVGFAIIMVTYAVYLMEYMKSEIASTEGALTQFEKLLK